MTKTYLALAAGVSALALSSVAMADGNEASTNQSGSELTSTIDVTQSGSNNIAGSSTRTNINPLTQTGGSGNSLTVTQSNNGNVVGISTDVSSAGGVGTQVTSSVQNGSNNTLVIRQSNTGGPNYVSYSQVGDNNGNLGAGPSNGVTGIGAPLAPNYGDPSINQSSSPMWNYVNQTGSGGNIVIRQNSSNSTGRNGIVANQGGTGNQIDLRQTTTVSDANTAYFDQRTASNAKARVDQTSTSGSASFAGVNLSDIRQTGSNGVAVAIQNGSALDLFITQDGANTATTNQSGSTNGMLIRQTLSGGSIANSVSATQSGTDARLTVTQDGYGNFVMGSGQSGQGSVAIISQSGAGNMASNTQVGLSRLELMQTGSNSTTNNQSGANYANISQQGGGSGTNTVINNQTNLVMQTAPFQNQLFVTQNGNSLSVDSKQDGYLLLASVDQIGSGNSYVGNQQGNNNNAFVLQGASGNVANVLQSGSANTARITQNR